MITKNRVSSDEIIINAPVETVWEVLVDFSHYGDWNTFCPSCEAELAIDSPIVMQVDLGSGLQEQIEYICQIEPYELIAWRMRNGLEDTIHAVRTQRLTKLNDHRCSYISVDDFSGKDAAEMMKFMAKPVETGFNKCGYDLKAHCEKLSAKI